DFRHYSHKCLGIDNDDIEDEEDFRHFSQRSLGINIVDEEDRPGPSSSGTTLIEGYSPENMKGIDGSIDATTQRKRHSKQELILNKSPQGFWLPQLKPSDS
ncbi:hypothetical protein AVEN_256209-1, partial [Araneus ventricosus]